MDPEFSYLFNLPSNAPLIALYRGGILVFIAFGRGSDRVRRGLPCIALEFDAERNLRRDIHRHLFRSNATRPQRGHVPQQVVLYSIFLAFLVYVDRERIDAREQIPAHPEPEFPGDVVVARF